MVKKMITTLLVFMITLIPVTAFGETQETTPQETPPYYQIMPMFEPSCC